MLDSSTDGWPLNKATMGCTSSAPSMVPTNATENNITFPGEMQESQIAEINNMVSGVTETKAVIENEVLPMCDNLEETKHLSHNDMSRIETVSRRIDKDVQTDSFRIDNDWNESYKLIQEEKVSKLEEVVEEAVEKLSQHNTSSGNSEGATESPAEPAEAAAETDPGTREAPVVDDSATNLQEDYEHLVEAISPSQSESSRATRWEALADIAAELPPSLAVDPLTGQIYTLTK